MSMWVKILEDPTGSHRTIFYKGKTDGGEERTPSAWLLPDQNRVAIRVSTRSAPDKGKL